MAALVLVAATLATTGMRCAVCHHDLDHEAPLVVGEDHELTGQRRHHQTMDAAGETEVDLRRKESPSTTCSIPAPRKGICSTGRMPRSAGWSMHEVANSGELRFTNPEGYRRLALVHSRDPKSISLHIHRPRGPYAPAAAFCVAHCLYRSSSSRFDCRHFSATSWVKAAASSGRRDLPGDHLHLGRVEAIEGDIERHVVLDLRRRVVRRPVVDLAHQRVRDRVRIEAVIGRRHARRLVIGLQLLRRVQEFQKVSRHGLLIVTRPRGHGQRLRGRAELILVDPVARRRQLHHPGLLGPDGVDVGGQLRAR